MDPIGLRPTGRVALVTDGGELTHRDLLRLVTDAARALPPRRGLVALLGDREPGTVAAYLATLRGGHTAAWFGAAGGGARLRALIDGYEPELLVGPAQAVGAAVAGGGYRPVDAPGLPGVVAARRTGPAPADIDPGTQLVLLTSGSVSGGRAVRLSGAAIAANCAAIRETLGIDGSSRGATSLPLYYTYGLSVLHSHLIAGGGVLLSEQPATGPGFWRSFAAAGCDIFSGVPMHFDWLDRGRVPWQRVASLRTLTVAGGRVRPALAARFHERCAATGRRFYAMYGQTEATARISVRAPEDYAEHPESVGRVVPGSRVTIEDGEVVYHGPGAMRGYADDRAGLALPDQTGGTVRTGDLGYLRDGHLYLTGRRGRFVKPDGRRIGLDAVEDVFAELAPAAAVGSARERAHVFVESVPSAALEAARSGLAARLGLSPGAVRLHYVPALPRRANGKVDYGALAGMTGDDDN